MQHLLAPAAVCFQRCSDVTRPDIQRCSDGQISNCPETGTNSTKHSAPNNGRQMPIQHSKNNQCIRRQSVFSITGTLPNLIICHVKRVKIISTRDQPRLVFINKYTVFHGPDIPGQDFDILGPKDGERRAFATRFEFVCEILRRIYSLQKGGILIMSEGTDWLGCISAGNLLDIESSIVFGKLSESIIGKDIDAAIRSGYSNDIASLSRVDGATIIDSDFRVLAFGAKLKARSSAEGVQEYVEFPPGLEPGFADPTNDPMGPHSIGAVGGMRHRSSAQFVLDNKGALVFTISEDGPISWFFWSDREGMVGRIKNAEAFIL